jgi:hypothetical protein
MLNSAPLVARHEDSWKVYFRRLLSAGNLTH